MAVDIVAGCGGGRVALGRGRRVRARERGGGFDQLGALRGRQRGCGAD